MTTEWPMDNFVSAWKVFREESNENIDISKHILSTKSWPRSKRKLHLLDLGCGDGKLISKIVLTCNEDIEEVHLLDPDESLLKEAVHNIETLGVVGNITSTLGTAEEHIKNVVSGKDAIIAVHIVYFIPTEQLLPILKSIPDEIPIYIILDEIDSVFTRIWKYTARDYYERSKNTHEIVTQLKGKGFLINKSTFTSHVKDPYTFREDIRNPLLSMLCYADFPGFPKNIQSKVKSIVKEYEVAGELVCRSVCYEIQRKG